MGSCKGQGTRRSMATTFFAILAVGFAETYFTSYFWPQGKRELSLA